MKNSPGSLLFFKNLYVGRDVERPDRIMRSLDRNAGDVCVYLLTLCGGSVSGEGSAGQLQFFHSVFLRQDIIRKRCPMIIGIAGSRTETVALVQRIVRDAVRETGRPDIVAYLSAQDDRIRAPKPQAGEGKAHR